MDFFISNRFHSYSIDEISNALGLSKKDRISYNNAIGKKIVRLVKTEESTTNNTNDVSYTLFIESVTANAIIRAAMELANTEKNLLESESPEKGKIEKKKILHDGYTFW